MLTAIGLTPCGTSTVHIYTQTMHNWLDKLSKTTKFGPAVSEYM